jgi:CPA1 family monovalent cation:H+ antiporter
LVSLSATDPVSVTALFRELGGKRLTTLMEGESLFNDGMHAFWFWLPFLKEPKFDICGGFYSKVLAVGLGQFTGGVIGLVLPTWLKHFHPPQWNTLTLGRRYGPG